MDDFLQFTFAGLALGARYALVALGFVIIYRATGVINFAQGGFVALGAYFAYQLANPWAVPFALAVVGAVAACALLGAATERVILRRLVGRPVWAVVMVTIGLLFVIEEAIPTAWGYQALNLADPWGLSTVSAGGVTLAVRDLWTLGLAAAALGAFFLFFQLSRYGLAMRAAAFDQEAALAQGISARRVVMLSWAIAGAVAAIAGVTLGAGSASVTPTISFIALAAFPAIILGGLDSPGGAIVGGLVIGVVQALTAGYQPQYAAWLGSNFHIVMPYVVMVLILMVRPYGLFGTPEVRRV